MSGYALLTLNGYDIGEAMSALQKEIRRGKEKEAMYWALELNSKFPIMLWKRLAVIVTEDIGGANPLLVNTVMNTFPVVMEIRKADKSKEYDLCILGHVILEMARSPKSREADNFVNDVLRERRVGKMNLEVPDYALDKHTAKGKSMGRGVEHFWEVGSHLENEAYPSQYLGWNDQDGDGYHTADGKKASDYMKVKGREGMGKLQPSFLGDEE